MVLDAGRNFQLLFTLIQKLVIHSIGSISFYITLRRLNLTSCCPRAAAKKLQASVAVPQAPVRVPGQRPLSPSVTPVTSVANDKGDNEMIPGICLTAEVNPGKP